jgi:hypothetical protein
MSVETSARSLRERWASVCAVSSPIFANAASEAAIAANGSFFAAAPLSCQIRSTRGPSACRMSSRIGRASGPYCASWSSKTTSAVRCCT